MDQKSKFYAKFVKVSNSEDYYMNLRDKLGCIAGLQSSETFVSLGGIVKNGNGVK